MNYEYQIAGLRVAVNLPFEISVQKSSAEFLTGPADENPDARFIACPVPELPEPPEGGYEENNRCYIETDADRQVFFRPSPADAPYACVIWKKQEPNLLFCEYLEGQESRLDYSMKICDMLGLESLLLQFHGLLLHTSFIRWKSNGILFSAASGVGKSTQADLWVKYQGAEVLNGDRAGLRKKDGIWTAYGLPYAGSSNVYRNESAPITAIFMLEQAPVNELRRLSPVQAIRKMYPQVMIHSWDPEYVCKALGLIEDLVTSVPVYLLKCRPDEEAVNVVKKEILRLQEKKPQEIRPQETEPRDKTLQARKIDTGIPGGGRNN